MEERLRKGSLVYLDGQKFRVFFLNEEYIAVINMSIGSIKTYDARTFMDLDPVIEQEDEPDTHPVCLPKEMEKIRKMAAMFEKIISQHYPVFERLLCRGKHVPELAKWAETFGLSAKQTRRLFTRYLRSGCDMFSLTDQRHGNSGIPGIHKTLKVPDESPAIDVQLEEALSDFKTNLSVRGAWNYLLRKYYRVSKYRDGEWVRELLPKDQCISYKKVLRYIEKNLGGKTISEYKAGEREYRNNLRQLTGNMRTGTITIGQALQVDECEVSVELVSVSDPNQVVGKAVLYCGFDPYADIITALHLGLKNNSYSGFCDLLITMLEPHSLQTERYGVKCNDSDFPSMYLPKSIYADHGSEYESQELERAMGELGIAVNLVPVAAGSYKGGVENVFKRLQAILKEELLKAGYITTDHDGPKMAKKQACLNIHGLRAIVYRIACDLNTCPIPGYSPDKEMMEAGIELSPSNIWKFEGQRSGFPASVTDNNRQAILFSLLSTKRHFTLLKKGRAGVGYRGHSLVYYCEEDWFIEMVRSQKPEFEARYRDDLVDYIYIRYKKEIHKVPLAANREELATFKGMDWNSYDELYNQSKKNQDNHAAKSRRMETLDFIEANVASAQKAKGEGTNNTKDIKESRDKEQDDLRKEEGETGNRLFNQDGEGQGKTTGSDPSDPMPEGGDDVKDMSPVAMLGRALEKLSRGEQLTKEESELVNAL